MEIMIKLHKISNKLIGSQILDKSRKGLEFVSYNVVPPSPTRLFLPPNLDLSNSGLEEFQQPEFEGYGPKTNDKLEKKTIFPTVAKIEFIRAKQQEKPVRKPVKYAEMYRTKSVMAWVPKGKADLNKPYFAAHTVFRETFSSSSSTSRNLMEDMLPLGEEPKEGKLLVKELLKLGTVGFYIPPARTSTIKLKALDMCYDTIKWDDCKRLLKDAAVMLSGESFLVQVSNDLGLPVFLKEVLEKPIGGIQLLENRPCVVLKFQEGTMLYSINLTEIQPENSISTVLTGKSHPLMSLHIWAVEGWAHESNTRLLQGKAITAKSNHAEPLQLLTWIFFGPTFHRESLIISPKIYEASEMVESNSDYAEELCWFLINTSTS
ncbi:hypothetical protein Tco_0345805 [Tanacetum coccineum]